MPADLCTKDQREANANACMTWPSGPNHILCLGWGYLGTHGIRVGYFRDVYWVHAWADTWRKPKSTVAHPQSASKAGGPRISRAPESKEFSHQKNNQMRFFFLPSSRSAGLQKPQLTTQPTAWRRCLALQVELHVFCRLKAGSSPPPPHHLLSSQGDRFLKGYIRKPAALQGDPANQLVVM